MSSTNVLAGRESSGDTGWRGRAASLLIGVLVASVAGSWLYHRRISAGEVALQQRARFVDATFEGRPTNSGYVSELESRFPASGADVFWFANSHAIAIVDPKPGEQPAVTTAAERLGRPVYQAALSQLNFDESLVLLSWMSAHRRPKVVVFQLPIYAMRFRGLRSEVAPLRSEAVLDRLRASATGTSIASDLLRLGSSTAGDMNDTVASPNASLQDRSEARLQRTFSNMVPGWTARNDMYATLLVDLNLFRNQLFGVTNARPRAFPPAVVDHNLAVLSEIVASARRDGATPLAYFAPVNPGSSVPYTPDDYRRLKATLNDWARRERVTVLDLESLVPPDCWMGHGNANDDFTHFNATGHRLLGEAIAAGIESLAPTSAAASPE